MSSQTKRAGKKSKENILDIKQTKKSTKLRQKVKRIMTTPCPVSSGIPVIIGVWAGARGCGGCCSLPKFGQLFWVGREIWAKPISKEV